MEHLIDRLRREGGLRTEEYAALLAAAEGPAGQYAAHTAREITSERFGGGVYIRGLIEIGNYCRNDCYYCGLRRSNRTLRRYRLNTEQIVACCRKGYQAGFRTFVLQGGEDTGLSDRAVAELIALLRRTFPDCALTLSLGERSHEAYCLWREAGADRYLLRHEAADAACYAHLHPASMSQTKRMECLHRLRDLGYQTGTGMMVGAPGQTLAHLAEDLRFIERFRPAMVGLGPYLPQRNTPFAESPAGGMALTRMLLSLVRIMLPDALVPATTALATLAPDGRMQGILAGANVVMPNLSPPEVRVLYAIYDGKASSGAEAAEGIRQLEEELHAIGCHIEYGRGDFRADR